MDDLVKMAITKGMSYSSASLCYASGSSQFTASVYDSYANAIQYKTDEYGHEKLYNDKSIMAFTADIQDWGLEPKKSLVTLNGQSFLVGGLITYTDVYQWITLRSYQHAN